MKIQAKLNSLRIAPRKVRIVTDVIKGMSVVEAMNQLGFMRQRSAPAVLRLFKSAIANAENNFKLKKENLEIAELRVDKGQVLKRWMPRAHGSAAAIHKFYSHVTLVLEDKTTPDKIEKTDEKKDEKKKNEDVVVVKDWDEAKKLVKEEIETETHPDYKEAGTGEEHKEEIENIRAEGKHREKQHLDKIRKKSEGGSLTRIFRRKSG